MVHQMSLFSEALFRLARVSLLSEPGEIRIATEGETLGKNPL